MIARVVDVGFMVSVPVSGRISSRSGPGSSSAWSPSPRMVSGHATKVK